MRFIYNFSQLFAIDQLLVNIHGDFIIKVFWSHGIASNNFRDGRAPEMVICNYKRVFLFNFPWHLKNAKENFTQVKVKIT